MKRDTGRAWAALPAIAIALAIPVIALAQGPNDLEATLKGKKVVPTAGAPSGSGEAVISPKGGALKVCYELSWKKVGGSATGAVIRRAPKGETGAIAATLTTGTQSGRSADGCTKNRKKGVKLTKKNIQKLKRKPKNFYVQIASETYPSGAIRGQLNKP